MPRLKAERLAIVSRLESTNPRDIATWIPIPGLDRAKRMDWKALSDDQL